MKTTCTTCPYCGVGCGVLASADGTIKGDPDHPSNFGKLCSKGAALGETIDLNGRLLHPQLHGKRTDWGSALTLVADKFNAAIRDHGPDSVAFYVSGQLLTEDYYVANKLMKGYIGSANIDTNSRLCMASSVAGHKRAFGTDTVPGTYEDLEQADLIVLVGSNLAWCHPVLFQRIVAAKATRPHMKIVNIDPRITATSDIADLHLKIAPDGDIALFNGLLTHLAENDHFDENYLNSHVTNAAETIQNAKQTDPTLSGLNTKNISQFYRLWASNKKVVTVFSQGVNQSRCGTDKVNAIINCHLATGRIGTPGTGPFSVTGQPNAMGGREVGGLANMLANHLDIDNADHRAAVQNAWQSPTICTEQGLKAVDLFDACARGKIKALWIMGTNPAASMPNADAVARAIKNVPFTVVSDIMARTDTGELVDLLLPATGWGEKDGTVTNSERRISRQRAFLPPPGAARPDWQIICNVAKHMGHGAAFNYKNPAAIFREYAALSKLSQQFNKDLDLTALSNLNDADYATLAPVQWPINGEENTRFFANGGFYHPGGKAKMIVTQPPQPASNTGQFILNTGRNRDQWHTMTRSGKSPRLSSHLAEPYVEIHPHDATLLGVQSTELLSISSDTGSGIFRVLVTNRMARGALFTPMHWTRKQSSQSTVNAVISSLTDPISGQPALKSARVDAGAFNARWYGFAASLNPMHPTRPYTAISRTTTGWQAEVAGLRTPADWEAEARTITNTSDGDAAIVRDQTSGQLRITIHLNDVLTALFFTSPMPVSLARSHAVSLIGTKTPSLAALAGRSAADQPDPGATVCACFNVGINTLRQAMSNGATTLDALGAISCAGTNCGSCKPELNALLAQFKQPMAAE